MEVIGTRRTSHSDIGSNQLPVYCWPLRHLLTSPQISLDFSLAQGIVPIQHMPKRKKNSKFIVMEYII